MFAFQHSNIQPDGLILGKALGGGFMPVSCFLASKEVMQWLTPGSHGSTFGGNPLAAAIGKRSLELLEEENLIENSRVLGDFFKNALIDIKSNVIKEVRGKGLWIGVVIDPNYVSGKDLSKLLLKEGILCKETHETVIRFAPPLVITKEEIEWALEIITTTLTQIENKANISK
jgi:ornithine--oxo-acid transaminase